MININLVIDELKKKGKLSDEQLQEARKEAKKTGMPLDKVLTKNGTVTEDIIASVVSEKLGIPFISLSDYLIDPKVIKLVPEALAQKYTLIPLLKVGNTLTIAMVNPQDINAIDQVRLKSKCEVEPILATDQDIKNAINQHYGVGSDIQDVIKGGKGAGPKGISTNGKELGTVELERLADAPPVIRLVNLLIMDAIKDKASDIHIEPGEEDLKVRYRIDGILHEGPTPPKEWASAIVSRIKVLAKMDIAEKRKPQDGRIQFKMQGRNVDLRISSFPTVYGENVVIRLLDISSVLLGLTDIGMEAKTLKEFDVLIRKPFGIILVTGPTGSGKTTTLYAALSTINTVEKNIITIEDPVEYHLKMIRQTQVNPKAGLTFATGLRSILRQDPDIIMVGEIRDKETAEIAIHAALTGHLVFSTLHTNDACGAVTRLVDMGIESFLVSSSVVGVLSQRLVRVICPKCKEKMKVTDAILKDLNLTRNDNISLYHGTGCKSCKESGYTGRIGIFELLLINEDMKKMIINKASSDDIKKKAIEGGMVPLHEAGMKMALNGVTTIEEVLRVTQE